MIMVFLVILVVVSLCLLSAFLGGFLIWNQIITSQIHQYNCKVDGEGPAKEQENECCKCIKLLLLIAALPFFWIFLSPVCLFLPLINICWPRKIVFDPMTLPNFFR